MVFVFQVHVDQNGLFTYTGAFKQRSLPLSVDTKNRTPLYTQNGCTLAAVWIDFEQRV